MTERETKRKITAEKIVGVYYSEINLEFLTNRIRKQGRGPRVVYLPFDLFS